MVLCIICVHWEMYFMSGFMYNMCALGDVFYVWFYV